MIRSLNELVCMPGAMPGSSVNSSMVTSVYCTLPCSSPFKQCLESEFSVDVLHTVLDSLHAMPNPPLGCSCGAAPLFAGLGMLVLSGLWEYNAAAAQICLGSGW
mmetsp:Transcript_18303/g.43786  ORF Transcript_18303/g.43786 Transcript_18303/m.43786 type:complete len:104 (+) Transcript_18303:194-505(+)